MTTVRIAHTEPWPGRRMGGRGFRISSFLVVLADDAGGPRHGHDNAQATARIEFTVAGSAEPRQLPVRIGYALALAAAAGAPVRVADQLMDRLAVPAQGDLVDQFTRDVALPRRRRGLSRLFRGHLFREHRPVRLAAH